MRKSRLSQYKQERLLELFIAGSTARIASRAGWSPQEHCRLLFSPAQSPDSRAR